MHAEAFHALLAEHGATAILRTPFARGAAPAMRAAIEGGFRVIEFTLTTPNALELITTFTEDFPDMGVGAGTVLTPDDARHAVEAGASFLVSPVTDPGVIDAACSLSVPMIAGTYTPTDMLNAHREGAAYQKLFPLPANAEDYIRACLGPMPFLKIVPTSGVTESNAAGLLRAGAHAVGFVGSLFDPADMQAERWSAIRDRAARCVAAVRST
jgi:Entner-Doudoroff aldolase